MQNPNGTFEPPLILEYNSEHMYVQYVLTYLDMRIQYEHVIYMHLHLV